MIGIWCTNMCNSITTQYCANANAKFFVIRNSWHLSMCICCVLCVVVLIGIYAVCWDYFHDFLFQCVYLSHHIFHSAIPFHWKMCETKYEWKLNGLGSALTIDAAPFGYEYSDGIKLYKLLCVSTFPAWIHEKKTKREKQTIRTVRRRFNIVH